MATNSLFEIYDLIANSGFFDEAYYLECNPDVTALKIDPLLHYLEYGAKEGRTTSAAFDASYYLEQCATRNEKPENPILHYLTTGAAAGLKISRDIGKAAPDDVETGFRRKRGQAYDLILKSGMFDTKYYLERNPDVAALKIDPVLHYLKDGARERRAPNSEFDTNYYLEQCKKEDQEPDNPLLHFIAFGAAAGMKIRRETSKPAGPDDDNERRLYVDSPQIVDGIAKTSVRGSFPVSGWALARKQVASVNLAVDDMPISAAHYGLRRDDVKRAFPAWQNSLWSGFSVIVPGSVLSPGRHRIRILVTDRAGGTSSAEFLANVDESENDALSSFRRKIAQADISLYEQMIAARPVTFGFLMRLPVDWNAIDQARVTIASLREQPYNGWRLTIILSEGGKKVIEDRLLAGFNDLVGRVRVMPKPKPASPLVSFMGDEARQERPTFFSILSPGDELSVDALLEVAVTANMHRSADFIYSDEICFSPITKVREAYFKPQWSPDLLLSSNYIGRLWCASTDLLKNSAARLDDFVRFGEYDLVLRLTERANEIRHNPSILCRRGPVRIDAESFERRALGRAMVRRGIKAGVLPGCATGIYRVRRTTRPKGLVSIIIPTRASGGLIKTCITTLRRITAYPNIEIICIENIPKKEREWKRWVRKNADKTIETNEPFNWSRFNNVAATHARGDYLLFLNDDVEIIEPGWLEAMLEHAVRPEVGIVGPLLLYPNRTVQHAGIVLSTLGRARHAFRYTREDDPGYFGLALTQRNVIGVTGACLLTRKEVFEALGRFDEAHRIINNDVDYCLKAWRSKLRVIFTPYAKLVHHEKVSRQALDDEFDVRRFAEEWRSIYSRGDPYFSPNLSLEHDLFIPERERVKIACSGGPLMARKRVKNILIVKLDHIGDCIAALPAVRFLKREFPHARFQVLAGHSTTAIWSALSEVDEIIEFEFFHPQSKRGARKLSADELNALRAKLKPHRFDIAIDLRKHPETRHFLQYSGARYLAGFDHHDEFSWLDVGLEWSGDRPLARKRSHVSEDLMNLAASVANAFASPLTLPSVVTKNRPWLPANDTRLLFNRRVVCIHPGAGMAIKEWPKEYFAELIDLLIEEDGVNVALIGGKDEASKVARVLKQVRHSNATWNFAGNLGLADLPMLLAKCALFVGNDSGPKHLAASLGVPTIGIHSGVVDDREWGPVGPRAVAIRREMSCSPCYLTRVEACNRNVACLKGLTVGEVHRACQRLMLIGRAPDPDVVNTRDSRSVHSGSNRAGRRRQGKAGRSSSSLMAAKASGTPAAPARR